MTKEKVYDFFILTLRWYLIWYMFSYGWSKLTMSQFGVHDPSILEEPLKNVNSFYIAWHLYGKSYFFNIVTGLLEIVAAILLIFNRTVLLGALMVLTVLGNILIIDISFTTEIYGFALPVRILGMMLSALLILFYYKERIISVFKIMTEGITTKFNYQWWIFLILPIIGFLMDFVWGIILMPVRALLDSFFIS